MHILDLTQHVFILVQCDANRIEVCGSPFLLGENGQAPARTIARVGDIFLVRRIDLREVANEQLGLLQEVHNTTIQSFNVICFEYDTGDKAFYQDGVGVVTMWSGASSQRTKATNAHEPVNPISA